MPTTWQRRCRDTPFFRLQVHTRRVQEMEPPARQAVPLGVHDCGPAAMKAALPTHSLGAETGTRSKGIGVEVKLQTQDQGGEGQQR